LPATLIAPLWQRGARGDFRAGGAEAAFGHPPLVPREMRYFKEVVSAHADESVTKWVDFFVWHKSSKPDQTYPIRLRPLRCAIGFRYALPILRDVKGL
jgi:hypothetical protein